MILCLYLCLYQCLGLKTKPDTVEEEFNTYPYVSADNLIRFIHLMHMFILGYKRFVLLMLGEQLCQTTPLLESPCSSRKIKHLLFVSQNSEAPLSLTLQR